MVVYEHRLNLLVQKSFFYRNRKEIHSGDERCRFFHVVVLAERDEIYVFADISLIKFVPFKPSPSFVEIPSTTGRPLRIVAFATIRTGLSVIAFASLLIEFPVKGAMTMQSSGSFGPRGSAFTMESIASKPVASSIFLTQSPPPQSGYRSIERLMSRPAGLQLLD